MKRVFSKGVQKFGVVFLALVIAAWFSWNFYAFGYWTGEKFLPGVPDGANIAGYLAAVLMFLVVMYTFFYREHAKEDIQAYSDHKGDKSYISAYNEIVIWVFGLELFSALFRCYVTGLSLADPVILGVSVVAMRFEYLLGKMVHAQANSPLEVHAERLMNLAGTRLFEEAPKYIPKMSAAQLRELAAGNPTPLDQVRDAEFGEEVEGSRRQGELRAKRQSFTEKFLAPRSKQPTRISYIDDELAGGGF